LRRDSELLRRRGSELFERRGSDSLRGRGSKLFRDATLICWKTRLYTVKRTQLWFTWSTRL